MFPALTLAVLVYTSAAGDAGVTAAGTARARLAEALRGRGATVVDHAVDTAIADRRAGWRKRDELRFFGDIRGRIERGRRARERVELEEATRLLGEAEAQCARHAAAAGLAAFAGEAALERGVVLAELGRGDEARAAFVRALGLNPSSQLTERNARPDVVRLFRQVAAAPRQALPAPAPDRSAEPSDPIVERLERLRHGLDPEALIALLDALDADALVVAVLAPDGRRALGARVEPRCASAPITSLEADALLSAACEPTPLRLALDDPRLQPPPISLAAAPRPASKKARRWPWIFAGALGVTAALIGVTVGVVTAEPRYTLKIDGKAFGAP